MSIEVKNITKYYGTQKALDNISFTVKKGEIVGFLGPNGAGKSTLMKILTTYIQPSEGEAFVNNFNIKTEALNVQKSVGYLPEHNPLYLEMYVKEYLEFNASIYKIATKKATFEEVIQKTGLTAEQHKKIGQLSKGYRQRVGLAAALLHNPEVLILDEPTTGLDPNQLAEIRNLIKNLGKNKTIFLSTHIMQEVEAICNRVIIINKGKIVADNSLADIQNNHQQVLEVEFDIRVEAQLLQKLTHINKVENIHDNLWELTFDTEIDQRSQVFDFAQANGLKMLQLLHKNKNLEAIFREITV
jgi:ABC-2 type transport system ATP-binding protein